MKNTLILILAILFIWIFNSYTQPKYYTLVEKDLIDLSKIVSQNTLRLKKEYTQSYLQTHDSLTIESQKVIDSIVVNKIQISIIKSLKK